jgi:very-short-patch-repair endonuclease
MNRIINDLKRKDVRKELRRHQTPEELRLWSLLRNNKVGYKWRRQVSIGLYIVDFYCRSKLLVIEIDGSQHKENKMYDEERSAYFLNLGIRTLRFWNSEIEKNIKEVMQKIDTALKSEGSGPAFPLAFQERG